MNVTKILTILNVMILIQIFFKKISIVVQYLFLLLCHKFSSISYINCFNKLILISKGLFLTSTSYKCHQGFNESNEINSVTSTRKFIALSIFLCCVTNSPWSHILIVLTNWIWFLNVYIFFNKKIKSYIVRLWPVVIITHANPPRENHCYNSNK